LVSALIDADGDVEYGASRGAGHEPGSFREWGSVTKSLTACAVHEAAARGLLDLDAEVRSLVSRLPAAR
jgi:CubicO group peptidase (beta-lactamase class C family)